MNELTEIETTTAIYLVNKIRHGFLPSKSIQFDKGSISYGEIASCFYFFAIITGNKTSISNNDFARAKEIGIIPHGATEKDIIIF